MKTEILGDTLRLSEIGDLGSATWNKFRNEARSAFVAGLKHVEVDLSQTKYIDSCGLGALIALQKAARSREGSVRLLRPQPAVLQILELTRMHQILEIVRS